MTVLKNAVLVSYDRLNQMVESNTVDEETVYFLSGKDVVNAIKGIQVPSIEGLAKATEVDTKLETYAKKSELPDITTLATKAELAVVESHISTVDVDAKLEAYNSDVETTYAKKTELPHFTAGENIAISEDGVISASIPEVDLSDYVKNESLSLDDLDLVAKYEAAKIKYDNPLAAKETTENH